MVDTHSSIAVAKFHAIGTFLTNLLHSDILVPFLQDSYCSTVISGPLHMIGAIGKGLTPKNEALLKDWELGGFFLQIDDNFDDPMGCVVTVNALQHAALAVSPGVPLLITMAQEGAWPHPQGAQH